MSDDKDKKYDRNLAWIQTYTSVIITIGAVFGAAGFSVLLTVLSQKDAEQNLENSASILGIPVFMTNGIVMIIIGIILVSFGFILAYFRIKRKYDKSNHN